MSKNLKAKSWLVVLLLLFMGGGVFLGWSRYKSGKTKTVTPVPAGEVKTDKEETEATEETATEAKDYKEETIKTTVHDFFTIALESNPTTGYRWEVDFNSQYLQLMGEEYKTHIQEQVVGAGGKEIFTFQALKAGETEITFSYLRPWEKEVIKKEVFKIIIN